jgi:transposase-like protein
MREIEVVVEKTKNGVTPAEERYRRMVDECARSGDTVAAVAARHGVAAGTFRWWRAELKRRDRIRAGATPSRGAALLPVRVTTPWPSRVPAASAVFEVALSGGRRVLRIPTGFDPADVRVLVEAVESGSC